MRFICSMALAKRDSQLSVVTVEQGGKEKKRDVRVLDEETYVQVLSLSLITHNYTVPY